MSLKTGQSSPLDRAVASASTNSFKVRPIPKLSEFVGAHGFTAGMMKHEEALEQWRQQLERDINQRIEPKAPLPSGKL